MELRTKKSNQLVQWKQEYCRRRGKEQTKLYVVEASLSSNKLVGLSLQLQPSLIFAGGG
jgi:hypothetical protein